MLPLIISLLIVVLLGALAYYYISTNDQSSQPTYTPQPIYTPQPVYDPQPLPPPLPEPTVQKSRLATVNGRDFLCPQGYYYEGDATQQACVKEGESGYVCPSDWAKVSGKPYCQYSPDTSGNDNASSGDSGSTTTGGGQPPPPIDDQSSTTTTQPPPPPEYTQYEPVPEPVYTPTPRKIRKIYKESPWREGIVWNDKLSENPSGWKNSAQVMDVYEVSAAEKDTKNSYSVYTSAYNSNNDVFKTFKIYEINNGKESGHGFGISGFTTKMTFAVRKGVNKGCVGKVSSPYFRQMVQLKPERTDCSSNGWAHDFKLG